jgi:hypothetical protein
MGKLKTLASALVVAAALVICTDYVALAATGNSLLLGRINHAGAVTTIDRTTNGPALRLTTNNAGAAPIVTNGHGRVANLNADRVDGKHAAAFAPKAHAPIAAGSVTPDGLLTAGWGISGNDITWDTNHYVIAVPGSASYLDHVVTVTPICAAHHVAYGSAGGDLTVQIFNAAGTAVQCAFGFIIVKL